jgi:hypothetical protein
MTLLIGSFTRTTQPRSLVARPLPLDHVDTHQRHLARGTVSCLCRSLLGNAGLQQEETCTISAWSPWMASHRAHSGHASHQTLAHFCYVGQEVWWAPTVSSDIVHSKILSAGDISHIEVMGQHIVVLNSVKAAIDMLDKKSTLYSDRPIFPVAGELVGWKHTLALLPDGDRFRRYRRNLHRVIGSRAAVGIYNQIEEVETRRFLKRVLTKPGQLQAHIRRYVLFVLVLTRS